LGVMVAAVLGRQTHPRRHAGLLQIIHHLMSLLGAWPPPDQGIEGLLVLQPRGEIHEPLIFRPLGVSRHPSQGAPFGLREAGDGQPPILPEAGIDAMGRCRPARRRVGEEEIRSRFSPKAGGRAASTAQNALGVIARCISTKTLYNKRHTNLRRFLECSNHS
jgi:hypothetical protein